MLEESSGLAVFFSDFKCNSNKLIGILMNIGFLEDLLSGSGLLCANFYNLFEQTRNLSPHTISQI